MGITLRNAKGRVLTEALEGGRRPRQASESLVLTSDAAANGLSTVLVYQKLGNNLYLDEACFAADAATYLENPCAP